MAPQLAPSPRRRPRREFTAKKIDTRKHKNRLTQWINCAYCVSRLALTGARGRALALFTLAALVPTPAAAPFTSRCGGPRDGRYANLDGGQLPDSLGVQAFLGVAAGFRGVPNRAGGSNPGRGLGAALPKGPPFRSLLAERDCCGLRLDLGAPRGAEESSERGVHEPRPPLASLGGVPFTGKARPLGVVLWAGPSDSAAFGLPSTSAVLLLPGACVGGPSEVFALLGGLEPRGVAVPGVLGGFAGTCCFLHGPTGPRGVLSGLDRGSLGRWLLLLDPSEHLDVLPFWASQSAQFPPAFFVNLPAPVLRSRGGCSLLGATCLDW